MTNRWTLTQRMIPYIPIILAVLSILLALDSYHSGSSFYPSGCGRAVFGMVWHKKVQIYFLSVLSDCQPTELELPWMQETAQPIVRNGKFFASLSFRWDLTPEWLPGPGLVPFKVFVAHLVLFLRQMLAVIPLRPCMIISYVALKNKNKRN